MASLSLTSRGAVRRLTAAALVTTAVVHLDLVPQHLREAPYAAGLFAALSVSALAVAVLLVRRDDAATWLGAEALSLGALLAYAASRSVGLPSLGDDVGDWLNPLGLVAVAAETTTVIASSWALSRLPGGLPRVSPHAGGHP